MSLFFQNSKVNILRFVLLIITLALSVNGLAVSDEYITDTLYVDFEFGQQSTEVSLSQATAIEILPNRNVLVVDCDNHRIVIFSPEGKYLKEMGTIGSGEYQFFYPRDAAVGSDRIFIIDSGNNRVAMLSFDLEWLGSIDFDFMPDAIISDNNNGIYVGSFLNRTHLLAKYDLKGNLIKTIGTPLGDQYDDDDLSSKLNEFSVDWIDSSHFVICHNFLAYIICGDSLEYGWVPNIDLLVKDFNKLFKSVSMKQEENSSITYNLIINALRKEKNIGKPFNYSNYITDICSFNHNILLITYGCIFNYSCSGKLIKKSVVINKKGERFPFSRITCSPEGRIYLMNRYSNHSMCYGITYQP